MHPSFALNRYLSVKETTIAPEDIMLKLLDGVCVVVEEARVATLKRDVQAKARRVDQALAIISELLAALDDTSLPDTMAKLRALYSYAQSQLLQGSAKLDPRCFENAARVLRSVAESFHLAVERRNEEARQR